MKFPEATPPDPPTFSWFLCSFLQSSLVQKEEHQKRCVPLETFSVRGSVSYYQEVISSRPGGITWSGLVHASTKVLAVPRLIQPAKFSFIFFQLPPSVIEFDGSELKYDLCLLNKLDVEINVAVEKTHPTSVIFVLPLCEETTCFFQSQPSSVSLVMMLCNFRQHVFSAGAPFRR